ncbi:hypothetical protein [Halalkalibaculum sp. DA384]|uniref:hypothetical protein n=1 Tax=Halalkalibaculum sp. DA384 TaxID=3373606 RepID=UPI003754E276
MNESEKGAKEYLEDLGFIVEINDDGQPPKGFKMPDFYIRKGNSFKAYCEFKQLQSIMEEGQVKPRKIFNKLFSKLKKSGKQLKLNYKNLIHFTPNIAFLNCTDSSITKFDVRDVLRDESTIPINGFKSFSESMRLTVDKYLIHNIDMILITNNNFQHEHAFLDQVNSKKA